MDTYFQEHQCDHTCILIIHFATFNRFVGGKLRALYSIGEQERQAQHPNLLMTFLQANLARKNPSHGDDLSFPKCVRANNLNILQDDTQNRNLDYLPNSWISKAPKINRSNNRFTNIHIAVDWIYAYKILSQRFPALTS